MTIQERIDRARAELERQEAEENDCCHAWPIESQWHRSNMAVVRARNLNPARLAVARGELEYAIERRDDLSASSADWNVSPDDKAAMLDEMFDGNGGLSIAECLLGLESAS